MYLKVYYVYNKKMYNDQDCLKIQVKIYYIFTVQISIKFVLYFKVWSSLKFAW